MEDRDHCRVCGEKCHADAPRGLCPACLLRAGLAGGAPAEGDQDWNDMPDTTAVDVAVGVGGDIRRGRAGEELAESLAGIPRVHLRDAEPFTQARAGGPPLVCGDARPIRPPFPAPTARRGRPRRHGRSSSRARHATAARPGRQGPARAASR